MLNMLSSPQAFAHWRPLRRPPSPFLAWLTPVHPVQRFHFFPKPSWPPGLSLLPVLCPLEALPRAPLPSDGVPKRKCWLCTEQAPLGAQDPTASAVLSLPLGSGFGSVPR